MMTWSASKAAKSRRSLAHPWRRESGAFLVALALAGCGGGELPLADEASASADISAAVIRVPDLELSVPTQAAAAGTPFILRREAAGAAEIARYTLAPAGQPLQPSAELRFERAGLPAAAAFFWMVDGELWLLPSRRLGNVLTARLATLGYADAVAASLQTPDGRSRALAARPQASGGTGGSPLVVQQLDCQSHLAQLALRLKNADRIADMPRAVGIAVDIVATQAACDAIDVRILELDSCEGLQRAVSRAEATFAKDFAEFESLTAPLYGAQAYVQLTGVDCTPVPRGRVDDLVEAKFGQFLAILQSQQLRGDFASTAGARELRVLFGYHAQCQLLGLTDSCARLTDTIFPNLLDGMRAAAFDQCRANGAGLAVAQLHRMGSEVADPDNFLGFARFPGSALESDLVYCTDPLLDLRVFNNASVVPEELTTRAKALRPLLGLGSYATGVDIEVPRKGSLTVGGRVSALQCADGSFSAAEMVARIGGREIARRGVSAGAYTVTTAPLDLVIGRVLTDAGLDPEKTSGFTIEIFREGGQCLEPGGPAYADTFKMFEIRVALPGSGPVTSVLRGPLQIAFASDLLSDLFRPDSVSTTQRNFALSGTVEERDGRLVMQSLVARGEVVERSTTLGSRTVTVIADGSQCTFVHEFKRVLTTTLLVGNQSNSTDLTLHNGVLTLGEFSVRSPTRVRNQQSATLQSTSGNCKDVDTSPPEPSDDTFDSQISRSELLSRKSSPAFSATLVTDATGHRSVVLSGSTTDSLPRDGNGNTISQSASALVSLSATPQ
jgi:hypothetical protein